MRWTCSGLAKNARGESLQPLQPVAPRRADGPARKDVDERQSKGSEVLQILKLSLEMWDARRIRVV